MLLTGDISILTDLISNVGFPIFVVIYLLYNQKSEREDHKKESKAFTKAIENNTLALQKMSDKLDAMEDK